MDSAVKNQPKIPNELRVMNFGVSETQKKLNSALLRNELSESFFVELALNLNREHGENTEMDLISVEPTQYNLLTKISRTKHSIREISITGSK